MLVPQGKVATGRLSAVELCFGPGSGPPLVVTQTASYSPGMTPGTVNWSFKKSVQLPAVYDKGVVNMFTGDSAVSEVMLVCARFCKKLP